MDAFNLYLLTRETSEVDSFLEALSHQSDRKKCRPYEVRSLEALVSEAWNAGATVEMFDDFVFSFSIPHISSEIDLLKVGDDAILNIELKSDEVSEEDIELQLRRNRYYLSFVSKNIYSFTFLLGAERNRLYRLDGELREASLPELCDVMKVVKNGRKEHLEELFHPADYLVSPTNSPERFFEHQYFLTDHQQHIKSRISSLCKDHLGERIGITGPAGTGKTLLLYDMARTLSENFRVCVVHGGYLTEGHIALQKMLGEVPIFGAREVLSDGVSLSEITFTSDNYPVQQRLDYDILLVDESHHFTEEQGEKLLARLPEAATVLYFYDSKQLLSLEADEAKLPKVLEHTFTQPEYRLTSKIRTNQEVAAFIQEMLLLRESGAKREYRNIDVYYANGEDERDKIVTYCKSQGYEFIDLNPYCCSGAEETREWNQSLSGQEFDRVAVVMDECFFYQGERLCCGAGAPENARYYQYLVQAVSRTRHKLCIIVLRNQELFHVLLQIKNQKVEG